MRILLSLVLLLMLSAPADATDSSDQDARLIVPSHRIGPAHLGMTRAAIDEVNRNALCSVRATYDASGRAMWLQTNWGGGCLISDKIQVGLFVGPVFRAFGKPDRIAQDARYPHATAFWISYQARGIAFRVLGSPSGAIIQTIAVFPGIASHVRTTITRSSGSSFPGSHNVPERASLKVPGELPRQAKPPRHLRTVAAVDVPELLLTHALLPRSHDSVEEHREERETHEDRGASVKGGPSKPDRKSAEVHRISGEPVGTLG